VQRLGGRAVTADRPYLGPDQHALFHQLLHNLFYKERRALGLVENQVFELL
jgi:hypothetical protein